MQRFHAAVIGHVSPGASHPRSRDDARRPWGREWVCSGPSWGWCSGMTGQTSRSELGRCPRPAAPKLAAWSNGVRSTRPSPAYRSISLPVTAQSSGTASGKGDGRGVGRLRRQAGSGVSGDDSGGTIMDARVRGGGEWLLPVTPADLRKRCADAWGRNVNCAF